MTPSDLLLQPQIQTSFNSQQRSFSLKQITINKDLQLVTVQRIKDYEVFSPFWSVYVMFIITQLRIFLEEGEETLQELEVVETIKKAVFSRHDRAVCKYRFTMTVRTYAKPVQTLTKQNPGKNLWKVNRKYITSRAAFDISQLAEDGEYAVFSEITPGRSTTCQGMKTNWSTRNRLHSHKQTNK